MLLIPGGWHVAGSRVLLFPEVWQGDRITNNIFRRGRALVVENHEICRLQKKLVVDLDDEAHFLLLIGTSHVCVPHI